MNEKKKQAVDVFLDYLTIYGIDIMTHDYLYDSRSKLQHSVLIQLDHYVIVLLEHFYWFCGLCSSFGS